MPPALPDIFGQRIPVKGGHADVILWATGQPSQKHGEPKGDSSSKFGWDEGDIEISGPEDEKAYSVK